MRRHPDFLAGIYGCGYTIIAIIIVITIVTVITIIIPVRDGLYKFAENGSPSATERPKRTRW